MTAEVLALQSDERAEAAKKTAAPENYGFKSGSKGAKGENQPAPIEGRYRKDQFLSLKSGSAEGFKKAAEKDKDCRSGRGR